MPEDAPLNPRSTYAATKLAQEHLAGAWARQTGGSVWAMRYHNVYGPRMPQNTPYAGVASLFRSALVRGEAPLVLEDGRQQRDFVHVHDVARANVLALTDNRPGGRHHPAERLLRHPAHGGRPGGGAGPSVRRPSDRAMVGGARAADVRHVVADPARARELLGFTAEIGFEKGIADFATAELRDPV